MKDWDCGVRPLAGHRVLLVTPGCPALAGLGDGLSGLGADCREVFAAEDCAALAPLEAAFARSEAELGGLTDDEVRALLEAEGAWDAHTAAGD